MPILTLAGKAILISANRTIGSAPSCDLTIAHPSISPQHARLFNQGAEWFLEDLMSATGCMLNGKRITGPSKLAEGDRIQIGDVTAEFSRRDPSQSENDATTPMAKVESLVGLEIAGFLITSFLRHETTGPLFKAKHSISEKVVLFWVFHPELVKREGPEFLKRFKDTVAPLIAPEHPNLMRVYQYGQFQEYIWYVTDLPDGITLEERIKLGFSPSAAIETTLAICRHLAVFHKTGLTHGEIRPALIHCDAAGQVRLGSIGISAIASANRRQLLCAPSSRQVHYLDPEQTQSGECNVKNDLYSVGCILVHLLTGKPPYSGNDSAAIIKAHAVQPVPRLAATHKLPHTLDDVLQGMLAKTHLHRFDSLEPAIDAIATLLAPSATGSSAPLAAAAPPARNTGKIIAIAAGLVVAFAAVFLFLGGGDSRLRDIARFPPAQALAPLKEADLPNLVMVNIEDQHHLSQGTGTACQVISARGVGLLVSDSAPSIGAKVYATQSGTVHLTSNAPLRYVPQALAKEGQLPKDVVERPLFRHVPSKAVDELRAKIEQREKERKDRETKLAEEEKRKAEMERQRAEEIRLKKEREKAEEEAKALAALQAAEQAKQEAERQRLAKIKTVADSHANSLAKLADKLEKTMIVADKPVETNNVSKDFVDSNSNLIKEVTDLAAFLKDSPEGAAIITAHADYQRYDTALNKFKALCEASDIKKQKFQGFANQPKVPDVDPNNAVAAQAVLEKQITKLETTIDARERSLSEWRLKNPATASAYQNAARNKHIQDYERETDRLRLQLSQLQAQLMRYVPYRPQGTLPVYPTNPRPAPPYRPNPAD